MLCEIGRTSMLLITSAHEKSRGDEEGRGGTFSEGGTPAGTNRLPIEICRNKLNYGFGARELLESGNPGNW